MKIFNTDTKDYFTCPNQKAMVDSILRYSGVEVGTLLLTGGALRDNKLGLRLKDYDFHIIDKEQYALNIAFKLIHSDNPLFAGATMVVYNKGGEYANMDHIQQVVKIKTKFNILIDIIKLKDISDMFSVLNTFDLSINCIAYDGFTVLDLSPPLEGKVEMVSIKNEVTIERLNRFIKKYSKFYDFSMIQEYIDTMKDLNIPKEKINIPVILEF